MKTEANTAWYAERHPGVPEAAEIVAAAAQWDEVKSDEEQTHPAFVPAGVLRRPLGPPCRVRRAPAERPGAWYTPFDATNVDYHPDLQAITAPTVVLTGRHDFICGPVWAAMHEGASLPAELASGMPAFDLDVDAHPGTLAVRVRVAGGRAAQ